jgi:hypothetical protein
MSLASPALTTTRYTKPKAKITKSQQAELERGWRERNQRLRDMGLPKETLEQYTDWVYGRGKKTSKKTQDRAIGTKASSVRGVSPTQDRAVRPVSAVESAPEKSQLWVTGACAIKPSPTYTGTKIIGIAVLHKSCLQPMFSEKELLEVAKMRR